MKIHDCPFCGSSRVNVCSDMGPGSRIFVCCDECDARGPSFDEDEDEEKAIKAWNMRTACKERETKP